MLSSGESTKHKRYVENFYLGKHMKLQFENNLDYQLEAISAVVDIFDGQAKNDVMRIEIESNERQRSLESLSAVSNSMDLGEEIIVKNIQKIQQRNGLEVAKIMNGGGQKLSQPDVNNTLGSDETFIENGLNFTVEMETGTGKTYVYLRTIHELRAKYGWRKFIIVVPSVAIKEGVLKNLAITRQHFASLYDNQEIDYYVWDAKKRGQARQFASSDTLQIMVITIDSFAKSENIINKNSDYGTPLHFIQATNPIVILDEPQNMETDKRRQAIASLHPLCTLRYSATHKNLYNLVYRLNPVEAYDQGLVKKIEVDSVMSDDSFNNAYINFIKIERQGKSKILAQIEIDTDDKRGLQKRLIKIEPGANLFELSNGREVYEDYILDEINMENSSITFTNGRTFYVGQKDESNHEEIIKYQIERTIENHFEKELKLAEQGIKILSLFFIDKVANYRQYRENGFEKGKFAVWFEEAFNKIRTKPKFAKILTDFTAGQVHGGYFAADKKGRWKDSRDSEDGGKTKDDDSAYELIMKDKERLLDARQPLRFIFSHSALREGWDNPNVFNICTLNETSSEMKKRQEIGRGLRLPVNARGERIRDENVNVLTIIANESYEDFSRKLQAEIETETGIKFNGRIKNKAERQPMRLTKRLELDENFKELWQRIEHQTCYQVEFSSDQLIAETIKLLGEVTITKPKITNLRTRITSMGGGIKSEVRSSSVNKTNPTNTDIFVPNILSKIAARTKITRRTIFDIIDQSGMIEKILVNPQMVIDEVSAKINQALNHLIIDNIKYEKTGKSWDMRLFENAELEAYIYNTASKSGAIKVEKPEKTIYDFVDVDSEIEYRFMKDLEARGDIKFYIKLPNWFTIDTPLGKYNPDWAIVFEGDAKIYFIAETKGSDDLYDEHLGTIERSKILAARKHFEKLGVPYIAPVETLTKTLSAFQDN
jgi:type III restriction enzyme